MSEADIKIAKSRTIVGVTFYVFYLMFIIRYFPLYFKRMSIIGGYNDRMVIFDAMILLGGPVLGLIATSSIIEYIAKKLERFM